MFNFSNSHFSKCEWSISCSSFPQWYCYLKTRNIVILVLKSDIFILFVFIILEVINKKICIFFFFFFLAERAMAAKQPKQFDAFEFAKDLLAGGISGTSTPAFLYYIVILVINSCCIYLEFIYILGTVSKTITAPIERVKLIIQTQVIYNTIFYCARFFFCVLFIIFLCRMQTPRLSPVKFLVTLVSATASPVLPPSRVLVLSGVEILLTAFDTFPLRFKTLSFISLFLWILNISLFFFCK